MIRRVFDKRRGQTAFVVRTAGAAWLAGFLLYLAFTIAVPSSQPRTPLDPSLFHIIALLFVAPLFENSVMIIAIEFALLFPSAQRIIGIPVAAAAVIAGLAHLPISIGNGIGAMVVFGVMAYSYLIWTELSASRRYGLTVAQHLLANLPSAIALSTAGVVQ